DCSGAALSMWRVGLMFIVGAIACGLPLSLDGQEVFDFPDVEPQAVQVPEVQEANGDAADNPKLALAKQQLRPVLVVWLSLARRAAKLDDDQVKKLIEGIKPEFKKLAGAYAKNQNHFQGVMFFGNGPNQAAEAKDPRQLLAEAVAKGLEPIAREEQLEGFR